MPSLTRAQILEQLNNTAERLASLLKSKEDDITLDDLVSLAVITIGHAVNIYPEWKDIAHKLISDRIDTFIDES